MTTWRVSVRQPCPHRRPLQIFMTLFKVFTELDAQRVAGRQLEGKAITKKVKCQSRSVGEQK